MKQTVYHSFWDWAKQPWVKGGIPNIVPGRGAALRVLPCPVGRVHFAGDYTTIWAGWMQGAIQSGLRAARRLILPSGGRWRSKAKVRDAE